MRNAFAVLSLMSFASMANGDVIVNPACSSRTLTNDFAAYSKLDMVQHNTFNYRSNLCGVSIDVINGAWIVRGAVAYGTLQNRGDFSQTYQSGLRSGSRLNLVKGRNVTANLGATRVTRSGLYAGVGITVDAWKHNNGMKFVPDDPSIDFYLHDTYVAPRLTVGIRRTACKKIAVNADISGYLAHRMQSLMYDEPTYLLNNASTTRGWGTGIGLTTGAQVPVNRRLSIWGGYQYRKLQSGRDDTAKPTFRSSALTVGLSFRL